jgi:mannose-6-phosphate isomerase-like protein (cupin superfamily)
MNEIVNPRTGQRMTFLNESPDILEIDSINPPTSLPEPEHVHPSQESGCRVISGALRFCVAGAEHPVHAGESITIPANTPHFFWNEGTEDAHAVQWFRPALKTRAFFETLFALAQDGKLNAKGMPSALQIAAMIPFFADEIRPTRPPWPLQRAVGALLGPVARRRGYRATYHAAER